jgi:hypothetical protein
MPDIVGSPPDEASDGLFDNFRTTSMKDATHPLASKLTQASRTGTTADTIGAGSPFTEEGQ